jgi:glycosyltransferase involved in cell wall biosynthesis
MNICLLSNKYPPEPGGLAISVQRLARGLAASGQTVHVCAPGQNVVPGQVIQTTENGLTLHRLGVHRRVDDTRTAWFELVTRLHHQIGFDLLHGYYLVGAGFVAVYAGRYLGVPVVVSVRGNDLDRTVFNPREAGSILWSLAKANAVTAVSPDLARKARALAPGCQAHVIPNGVDASRFAPAPPDLALRVSLVSDDQTPLLGFVGEARLKKGLTILLPAFARVVAEVLKVNRPAPALLLVGGVRQDDADVLRVFQAQHPGLSVQTIPYLDQARLPSFYNLLDVLVLPSLRDGLPNALLEGMACECAVVTTNVGGMSEVVHHGENGLLVPPGDVDTLAEAITELLQTPERRAALGSAARQTIIRNFDPARELASNLEIYHQLLTDSATTGTLEVSAPGPPAR